MGIASLIYVLVSLGLMAVAVVLGVSASVKKADRDAARSAYFVARYAASVDQMLAQCPFDRDELGSVRDSGRSGPVKAVRLLQRSEPIPLAAAAEFIKRV